MSHDWNEFSYMSSLFISKSAITSESDISSQFWLPLYWVFELEHCYRFWYWWVSEYKFAKCCLGQYTYYCTSFTDTFVLTVDVMSANAPESWLCYPSLMYVSIHGLVSSVLCIFVYIPWKTRYMMMYRVSRHWMQSIMWSVSPHCRLQAVDFHWKNINVTKYKNVLIV